MQYMDKLTYSCQLIYCLCEIGRCSHSSVRKKTMFLLYTISSHGLNFNWWFPAPAAANAADDSVQHLSSEHL